MRYVTSVYGSRVMYRPENVDAVRTQADEIRKRTERELHIRDLPTKKRVLEVAVEFLKTRQRVVYGGYALNTVVAAVAPGDAFYDDDDTPDVEFYSTDPVREASEMAAFMYERGIRDISVLEASHYETYSISVDFWRMCDVSYMASRVYDHLPVLHVNGLRCLHPRFAIIDTMRIINDPTQSYHALEKTATRLRLILKHFPPFPPDAASRRHPVYPAPFETWRDSAGDDSSSAIDACRFLVREFAMDRTSLLTVGQVGLAFYCKLAPGASSPMTLEVVTEAFVTDAKDAASLLVAAYGSDRVKYGEKEALYDFVGRRGTFYLDGVPVLRLVHDDWRCHPYQRVLHPSGGTQERGFLQVGSFSQVALRLFVDQFEAVVDGKPDVVDALELTLYAMFAQRNAALTEEGTDVTSTTSMYRDFITQCKGPGYAAVRLKRMFNKHKQKEVGQGAFALTIDDFMERGRGLSEEARAEAFQRKVRGTYYLPRAGEDIRYTEKYMFQDVVKIDGGRLLLPGVSTAPAPSPAVAVMAAKGTLSPPLPGRKPSLYPSRFAVAARDDKNRQSHAPPAPPLSPSSSSASDAASGEGRRKKKKKRNRNRNRKFPLEKR